MTLADKLTQLNLPQPVAIIGAGLTGQSCVNLLQIAAIDFTVFDERDSVSDEILAATNQVQLGAFSAEHFAAYGTILLSPGVDTRRDCFAAYEDKLLTDIELFARLADKPLIGVTASNGKSTVVTLLHQVTELANKNYLLCGNIGVPVLQALLAANLAANSDEQGAVDGYIIELSSYHLERSPSLQLAVGVWLNVSPDHLDRYAGYDAYVATKAKLFAQSDFIVANADDERVYAYARLYPHKAYFSQGKYYDVDWTYYQGGIYHEDDFEPRGNESEAELPAPVFALKDFPQMGQHHADNLMAIFAVAEKLGIAREITAQACKNFTPLASRSVVVGQKNGVTFINDSKGTNIGATVAAISGMPQPIILIAGGQGKGQDFSELAAAAKGRVKQFILIGEDAEIIRAAVSDVADCQLAANLTDAVEKAIAVAAKGEVVMLSPACASFDMFSSYLKRGEAFEQLVKEWIYE